MRNAELKTGASQIRIPKLRIPHSGNLAMPRLLLVLCAVACCSLLTPSAAWSAPEILLPQARSAFQTNEWIDISVARSADKPLAAGELVLALTSEGDGRLEFTFPVEAGGQRKTAHLHVNGWLLRPGKYAVEAAVDGAKATSQIEVYSHIRQSSFRLINWGRASKPQEQLIQGEDNLGFNLFYGHYGSDTEANLIRAGVDFVANCVMSGGHQMDLRLECDWSDPHVTRGGTRRVTRRAMMDRTRPNVPGVHFYDEPGLTWTKDPADPSGKTLTPHGVAAQVRSYEAAFGRKPPAHH
jgi:hypothetical protein